ncbi:MAG: DNA helicase RecQ [Thermodesulfobacteriota bacterium]|nr:DNA helicase RecQ [Thermodesulfobacteriota bacterium]
MVKAEKKQMLNKALQKYWGFDSFLPLQSEAMNCVLDGRDSVVVLPTGGGKSLCFQAPALCMGNPAIVISPLISLMKDQVDALKTCGIRAAYINSTLSYEERKQVANDMRAGSLALVYIAPEKLMQTRTIEFLRTLNIAFIAIDEAHCISEWGHDFRPEYRKLGMLKKEFSEIAIHAYTATATEQVRLDIADQLGLKKPEILVGSFDRPNLIYKVGPKSDILNQVRRVMDRHPGDSGIIYCISRKDVERISGALNELGYSALPYHAGMSDLDRKNNQEAFIEEKVETIVATVAFGMGIDKSNVRYVIHTGMPKSLENYQQESGRAGRDGLEAECCLFYSNGDYNIWKRMLTQDKDVLCKGSLESLKSMINFCNSVICRHHALVNYFGQTLEDKSCGACDVCLGMLDLVDDPIQVGQKILSSVIRQEQRFGGDYTALVLKGSNDKRILQNRHNQLSTWGILANEHRTTIRSWIEQLVGQNYLEKSGEYNTLSVTSKGRRLLSGDATPRLLKPLLSQSDSRTKNKASVEAESWEGVDMGLFEKLRVLRRNKAKELNVPPFVVFGDVSLRAMAKYRPCTQEGFRMIKGVGDKKLSDYGPEFMECITVYCSANQLPTDIMPEPVSPPKQSNSSATIITALKSFKYFRKGLSVEETAGRINRAVSTTNSYLIEFIKYEGITDPAPWVDEKVIPRVEKAAADNDTGRLKPIFEALDKEIDYDTIRIVAECMRNRTVESTNG